MVDVTLRRIWILSKQLNRAERKSLHSLEKVIAGGLQSFIEVGLALLEIRDTRLYRDQYPTFEAYCLDRWEISQSQGYRLIDAGRVAEDLSPMGEAMPQRERQIRPLVPLDSAQRREVWSQAVEQHNGNPTGSQIEMIAQRALEGLSPEDQLEVLREEEKQVHQELATVQSNGKKATALTLLNKARRAVDEIGQDRAVTAIDQAIEALQLTG